MSFLGIDQSLNASGVCRLRVDGTVDAVGTVVPKGIIDGARLSFIKRAVAVLLDGVTHAALEGYSYNSVGHVFELGEIGGVLKVLLQEHNVPYVVVPPVLVKKYATGSTSAKKKHMLKAAREHGALVVDDNQADAFFLAHIARAYILPFVVGRFEHRYEMEVIQTLTQPMVKHARRRVSSLIKAAI